MARPWLPALIVVLALANGCGDDAAQSPEDSPVPTSTTTDTTTSRPTASTTSRPPTTTSTTTTTSSTTTSSTTTTVPEDPVDDGRLVWDRDFPDPFVLTDGDGYHAYATASGFLHVQRLDGSTLADWTGPADALTTRPTWATPLSSWAPAVLAVDDHYLLFYTARVDGTDKHCLSVAEGTSPDGPFVDASTEPWVCPTDLGGAIDPSPFVDADGSLFLLWKNDGITLRRESAIWSQRLTPDGRSSVGDPVRLIETDQDWEYPHVEAPSMRLVDGTYWLAYSGNWYNQAAYGIGLARCTSAVGPCEKPFGGPIISSVPGAEGPGGAEFFADRSGRTLLAYHAWIDQPGYPGHRALRIIGLDFSGPLPHAIGSPAPS